jgi:lipid A ethanolaminephosphotransferase
MNSYNIIIDNSMIRNIIQTNFNESLDLVTIKQILYFIFLGLLPSIIIYKIKINYKSFKIEILSRLKIVTIVLIIMVANLFLFSKYYTSFFREHKILRYYINPISWIYAVNKYIKLTFKSNIIIKSIGNDAKIIENNKENELVILVVGEAARADHFSLNGYSKQTNRLLEKENIINFSNMYSCGTSTAHSVPCMFSIFDKANYSYKKGISTQNIIDVLYKTGKIDILWRDNNSDPKGVMNRLNYEDFKSSKNNTICIDGECRDEGMLIGLDKYIHEHKNKDILIVLHQMGNHGPAYYKRYPKQFEVFKPICKTNQLEQCSKQEISNAYDNAILYTDYFLSKTINFLKQYDKKYETAMIYMSDHGESLGENGIYLHGLPYFIAPDAQKHIASLIWLGSKIQEDINITKLNSIKHNKFSHDNLFHTLLGIFEVKTKVYKQNMDILNDNK